MSLKRPLSPESNISCINTNECQLKRLKPHSRIQELRNEEAYLVLLKKLRANQQLSIKINHNNKTLTNGRRLPEKLLKTSSIKHTPVPTTNPPIQQQTIPITPRKLSNSPLLKNANKTSKNPSFEEGKIQAKSILSKQLERDLSNISLPKPSLQDIIFIPNGSSLEFQVYIGLEDVIQCFNELQNSRHRLPQRFTDHACVDEPSVCDQCGTDFTIRWWKHVNSKSTNQVATILCDRCKKQVTRRAAKSDHSTLLKNVIVSAMEQEKEIDKHFNMLIKQQKLPSRLLSSSKTVKPNNRPTPSIATTPTNSHQNKMIKIKYSSSQNVSPPKLTQQSVSTIKTIQKSNVTVQPRINHPMINHGNHSRTVQQNRTSMPIHHQEQYRSKMNLSQQTKINQLVKLEKNIMKKQSFITPPRSILPPNLDIINSILASNLVRQPTTKRSTFSTVEKK